MQLYVINKKGDKNILDIVEPTRKKLANRIGYSFRLGNDSYTVNEVFAEKSSNDTASGAIIGGLLGLLGGGLGVIIGGVAGGLIGGLRDEEELKAINRFNNSRV